MTEFLTSRSRILTGQRCPRARYWLDEARGTGFSPVKVAIPLATGGAVHAGLRSLLIATQDTPILLETVIERGVKDALESFRAECADRSLDLEELESQSFVFAEQFALTEALVRLAGMRVVPKILEQYEVLEVERMDRAELWSSRREMNFCPWCAAPVQDDCCPNGHDLHENDMSVLFRSIPDALVRSRSDGELYVISWKTTAEYSQQRDQDARTDMQGLSEPWALERRLNQWDDNWLHPNVPAWYRQHAKAAGSPEIRGVQMIYLIKGARRKASKESQVDGNGSLYKTASPLIYGYMSDKSGTSPSFAWSSDWRCSSPHPMRKSQWYPSGECPGDGRNHKRDDSWRSFPVWTVPDGVRIWMEKLGRGEVSPEAGDALDACWAMPVPHFRTRNAVESWERQTRAAETRHAVALQSIRLAEQDAAPDGALAELLDEHFPQSTERCGDWFHRRCPAWELCHGPGHVAGDPVGSGLFQVKTQYVPEESNG